MNLKNLSPENLIKLSSSITLLLTQKFCEKDLAIIKNILCLIANNLSSYETQKYLYNEKSCKK